MGAGPFDVGCVPLAGAMGATVLPVATDAGVVWVVLERFTGVGTSDEGMEVVSEDGMTDAAIDESARCGISEEGGAGISPEFWSRGRWVG